MNYRKTQLDTLTPQNIEDYISDHQMTDVPRLSELWEYYKGDNCKITNKKPASEGNPDNKTPVPYGRKIVTTFTGYAYRPKYITYKSEGDEAYFKQLTDNFKLNNEPIKTAMDGRNTAIFGVSYELCYVDTELTPELNTKANPRFFYVDPREIILLYGFESEPKKKIGIRYYSVSSKEMKVEVYYKDRVEFYSRVFGQDSKWRVTFISKHTNFFEDIPIVPYYFGDDCLGIIEPVIPLIDNYDEVLSSTINEVERFANAYIRLVDMKIGGTSVPNGANPGQQVMQWLKKLKISRVFEGLKKPDDVTFLTKDIPTDFFDKIETVLRKQIHTQSSVPDFTEFTDVSGAAVERLMFDFENVVSSAEADFDTGLYERIRLLNKIWEKTAKIVADPGEIQITHKRNMSFDLKELAETSKIMKEAGYSSEAVVSIMPDSVIPNTEKELERQKKEREEMLPDIDDTDEETTTDETVGSENAETA